MTANNREAENGEICKHHMRISSELDNEVADRKESQKELWDCLHTKVSTAWAKWFVIILITLSLSVVGFLYSGQKDILRELKESNIEASVERKLIHQRITEIKELATGVKHDLEIHMRTAGDKIGHK